MLTALLVLVGAIVIPTEASGLFEPHEVVIGPGERQTVLTGFLLGGAVADLAVVMIDDNGERRLRIFALGADSWAPRLEATLGSGV